MSDTVKRQIASVQQPPEDIQAETAALGGALANLRAAAYLVDALAVDDFYLRGHREIFGVLRELVLRKPARAAWEEWQGTEVYTGGVVMLRDRLRDRNLLDQVGGLAYLVQLWNAGVPGDMASMRYRAKRIEQASLRRRMLEALGSIQVLIEEGRAASGEPLTAQEIQDQVIGAVLHATRSERKTGCTLAEALIRQGERVLERQSIPALFCGLRKLDNLTGGLRRGEMGVICGRPGMGKTALGLMQAYHAANTWGPGLFISLEMDEDALAIRLLTDPTKRSFREIAELALCDEAGRWVSMSDDEADVIAAAAVNLAATEHQIYVETDAHQLSRIQSLVQRYRLEHEIEWLMVDYGQLARDDTRRVSSRAEEMAGIARAFKQLAQMHRIPVWVLAQPSRDVEKRQTKGKPERLRMSDLGWSGEWEAAANVIWFLNPDGEAPSDDLQPVVLEIGKSRNGPKGEVPLMFRKVAFKFAEREIYHDDPGYHDPDARAGY